MTAHNRIGSRNFGPRVPYDMPVPGDRTDPRGHRVARTSSGWPDLTRGWSISSLLPQEQVSQLALRWRTPPW